MLENPLEVDHQDCSGSHEGTGGLYRRKVPAEGTSGRSGLKRSVDGSLIASNIRRGCDSERWRVLIPTKPTGTHRSSPARCRSPSGSRNWWAHILREAPPRRPPAAAVQVLHVAEGLGRHIDWRSHLDDVLDLLAGLAEWSPWVPFRDALRSAPRLPGVYLAREGHAGPVVYVGMAGERAGSGKPQGLRGRLRVYASGKALTSGLGEAVADRAFADPYWLSERVDEARRGEPLRARDWGRATFERANLSATVEN